MPKKNVPQSTKRIQLHLQPKVLELFSSFLELLSTGKDNISSRKWNCRGKLSISSRKHQLENFSGPYKFRFLQPQTTFFFYFRTVFMQRLNPVSPNVKFTRERRQTLLFVLLYEGAKANLVVSSPARGSKGKFCYFLVSQLTCLSKSFWPVDIMLY